MHTQLSVSLGPYAAVWLTLMFALPALSAPYFVLPSQKSTATRAEVIPPSYVPANDVAAAKANTAGRQGEQSRSTKPTVTYRYNGPNGVRLKITGEELTLVNRDALLAQDPQSHQREVQRILKELEPILGPAADMDFKIRHWKPSHPELLKNSVLAIDFNQLINSTAGPRSMIAVNKDSQLILVQLAYLNPSQENLDPVYWLPEDAIVAYARHAIHTNLNEDTILEASFQEKGVHFEEIDEEMTVVPIYSFRYKNHSIQVNGINGELTVADMRRR